MKRGVYGILPALAMLPAVLVGAFAQRQSGVPAFFYMQNVVCALALGASACLWIRGKRSLLGAKPLAAAAACALALLATFVHPGAEGVHRWVTAGPISLYVAWIALPVLLIALRALLAAGRRTLALGGVLGVAALLALQPDASMVTAFGAASLVLAWDGRRRGQWALLAAALCGLAALSWATLDGLEPVAYVEGIFGLVCGMGPAWAALGAASLLALVVPFFACPPERERALSAALGAFFAAALLSARFGCFPVPLMGYGLSPIVGYFTATMWLARAKASRKA